MTLAASVNCQNTSLDNYQTVTFDKLYYSDIYDRVYILHTGYVQFLGNYHVVVQATESSAYNNANYICHPRSTGELDRNSATTDDPVDVLLQTELLKTNKTDRSISKELEIRRNPVQINRSLVPVRC